MRRSPRHVCLLGLFLALASLPTGVMGQDQATTGRDWTRWGGPNGTFVVGGDRLADQWPADGPRIAWSRPLGAGHSAILASEGRLYTMYRQAYGPGGGSPFSNEESVVALDASTGDTLWEHGYASPVQDFGQGAAPHATPLLVDGRLFTIGTNKELYAFDAPTGQVLWSVDLVRDLGAPPLLVRSMIKSGYGSSPLAYEDTIIVQVGGPGQSVVALRQDDGTVVWKSGSFLVSQSPPGLITVDGETQLVVFAGQAVHGMDPDTGAVLWAHPHDAGNDFNFQVPQWNEEDNVLFISSGYIAGSRAVRLRRRGDVTDVKELWYDPRLRFTFLNTLRLGEFIYGTSGQGSTAIMTATHMATGETAWRARGFSRASLLHADDKVIILEEDGTLGLATMTPEGMTTLAEATLFDTRSWTAPTLVGTMLYARDREKVLAVDLGDPSPRERVPDFSGLWTLDRDASRFTPPLFSGGRGGADVERLFITHARNGTIVIGPETNGRKAWSFVPGRAQVIPVGRDTTMTVESRWDDGRLVTEGTDGDLTMHETLELSADASTLTFVVTTTTTAEGRAVNRLVYRSDRPVGPCEQWAMPCKAFPQHVAPEEATPPRP